MRTSLSWAGTLRRLIHGLALVVGLASVGAAAEPLTVSFVPVDQTVTHGPILVDVTISGFGPSTAAGIGDFDFTVAYDPSIVVATGVSFGLLLGDPSFFEALTASDLFTTPGLVSFAEVSLLEPLALLALQAPSLASGFVLAQLEFSPVGVGTTPLSFAALIAGNELGVGVELQGGTGSIAVLAEPATLVLVGIGLLLLPMSSRRGRRLAVASVVGTLLGTSFHANAAAPAFGPRIKLLDRQGNATGLEYQVGTTALVAIPKIQQPPSTEKVDALNLRTPITYFNTTANPLRVIACATGVTTNLDTNWQHMKVQMRLDAASNFTCELPNAQNLKERKERLGAMGCRLITIPAKGQHPPTTATGIDALEGFISGNDRTVPAFKNHLPVPGQFRVTAGFGGVGPTQAGKITVEIDPKTKKITGVKNTGRAAGTGWGLVGGHPAVTSDRSPLKDKMDQLGLHLILLQDPKLGFVADPLPPPERDKAMFNCNKCFGMGPGTGPTGLDDFAGYHLEPLSAADRKGVQAIFANHWIKYESLKLLPNSATLTSLNLYSDDTYFAGGPVQVQYALQTTNLPPACAITDLQLQDSDGNSTPLPPGSPFFIGEEAVAQLGITVSCGSGLSPGSVGQLAVSIRRADASNPELLSQAFVRMTVPTTCDVNADGSVDSIDIGDIMASRGTAVPPEHPMDIDDDGLITVNDARQCTLACSLLQCAVPSPQ